ncbi:MAG TPA: hypothetical protein V6D48_03880, partial [Oculatellaceae cyanobacterium]
LLLNEFSTKLGIKYEEAQLNGKPKKRLLRIEDIEALKPFHWGYHFDKIIEKQGGFDAIITNPPWEIFKPIDREFGKSFDSEIERRNTDAKIFKQKFSKLLKDSKILQEYLKYQSQFPYISAYYRSAEQYKNQIAIVKGRKAGTDINLYKLFVEQCFNLLHSGGYCGIIVPTGIYTDLGTKQLREMLFTQSQLNTLFGISNERFIFEGVDHRFKFCLLTFRRGISTDSFLAAFRIDPREAIHSSQLERFLNDRDEQVEISVPLVYRLSPDSLSVMEFRSELDITIAEKMSKFPLLGEKITDKWNLQLTSEFHMTNDSHLFNQQSGKGRLPLYEGKMIHHFNHQSGLPRLWISEDEGRSQLLGRTADTGQILDYQQYRFAYRSITGSTNQRTMVCSILPNNVFCGNSLNISKRENNLISNNALVYLTAIVSSFVLDYALRQRVATQLNIFFVYQLPVPRLTEGDRYFNEIVARAAKLICTTPEFDDLAAEVGLGSHQNGVTNEVERAKLRAELDGIIAHLYELTEEEFAYVLTTFPVVPEPVKVAALNAYRDVERGLIKLGKVQC